MTDDNEPQPYRPPMRGPLGSHQRYDIFKQGIMSRPTFISQPTKKDLFTLTITAARQQPRSNSMDTNKSENTAEQQFLIDIIFKPNETNLRLRPAETQLLLAYIGEILAEIEDEEKKIIEEENAVSNLEVR